MRPITSFPGHIPTWVCRLSRRSFNTEILCRNESNLSIFFEKSVSQLAAFERKRRERFHLPHHFDRVADDSGPVPVIRWAWATRFYSTRCSILPIIKIDPLFIISFLSFSRRSRASDNWDWGGSAVDRTGWSTAEENHRTKRREGSGKMPNWIRKDKQVTRKYARDSVRVKTKTLVSFPFPGVPMGCLQYYIKDRDAI